jgi:rod shape-determining protein MreC
MATLIKNKYLVVVLVAFLGFLLLLQTPLFMNLRDSMWSRVIAKTGVLFGVGSMRVDNDVSEQMKSLLAENISLRAENYDYGRLQKQLGAVARDDFNNLSAMVIGRPADVYRSRLVLNKGANDGVVLGAPVVINGSMLVGKIEELNNNTSLLRLVYHPQTSMKAEVLAGEFTHKGLVKGKTYTGLEMVEIPRDAQLQEGQEVVTMSDPGLVPYGLVIGKISLIKSDDRDPYQKAQLVTLYDVDRVVAVNILTPQ